MKGEEIVLMFWKKYIQADDMERTRIVEETMSKSFEELGSGKIDKTVKIHAITQHLKSYFDDLIETLPMFRCPLDQCGGFMKPKEEKDWQKPNLVCENCGAVYKFVRFKK